MVGIEQVAHSDHNGPAILSLLVVSLVSLGLFVCVDTVQRRSCTASMSPSARRGVQWPRLSSASVMQVCGYGGKG